jgi:NAD(P)-dependent dehydrogenase (short-subunit alcohol dehydrogenase family)
MAGRLAGKVALVTGTASGIGRAVMDLFVDEGARVTACDVRADEGNQAAIEARQRSGQVHFVAADVSVRHQVRGLVDAAVERFGGLDIVVNNAAVGVFNQPLDATDESDWDRVLAINLKSVYLVSHFAIPHMRQRGGGAIVNVSSVHAFATTEGVAAYAAAKGGVLALTRQMALDCARDNIRVNALLPGAVDTDMLRLASEREGKTYEQMGFSFDPRSIGRIGRPDELARAVLFLVSDEASFVTGAPLIADGGLLARL